MKHTTLTIISLLLTAPSLALSTIRPLREGQGDAASHHPAPVTSPLPLREGPGEGLQGLSPFSLHSPTLTVTSPLPLREGPGEGLQGLSGEGLSLSYVMDLANWSVSIGFDEMSHEYHRYRYHIDHCEADWTVSEGIFESDYLEGLNDQPIEDYEKSFNTTQLYTHYALDLPNDDVQLLLSGNYRVTIYDEDDDEHLPLAVYQFALVDQKMSVGGSISGNTDIDFQRSHQQVSLQLSYGSVRVTDPERELHTFVIQNRRADRTVQVQPNIRKAGGLEFTHQRELIFPAGNECHKFEVLDVHRPNMNVDNMRWFEPYYHATLYEDTPARNYVYDQDVNGAYVIRNAANEDNETTSEYLFVHFRLKTDPLPFDVYVHGDWCTGWPNDTYKMQYDTEAGEYHAAIYLKQGYYNYRYAVAPNASATSASSESENSPTTVFAGMPSFTSTTLNPAAEPLDNRLDGNFFQTENEYQVLVYYREPGGRYDRLLGYAVLKGE